MMETEKYYTQPQFEFVRPDEQNRVFFAASGQGPTTATTVSTTAYNQGTTTGWF